MVDILKKFFALVGVLVISTAIYFVVSEDNQFKEDIFDRSLKILGEQFISLIHAPTDKIIIKEQWQKFSEQAQKGEVPAEQVERVAIGILNASNMNEEFTREDAETILQLAYTDLNQVNEKIVQSAEIPGKIELKRSEIVTPKEKISGSGSNKSAPEISLETTLHKLGEKLEVVCSLNQKIKEACEEDTSRRQIIAQNLRYQMDNGLHINVDLDFKNKMTNKGLRVWQEQIANLEKKQMIKWRPNYANELKNQSIKTRAKLDSLQFVFQSQITPMNDSLTIMIGGKKRPAVISTLDKLQSVHVVNVEEIEKIVHENLKRLEKSANKH